MAILRFFCQIIIFLEKIFRKTMTFNDFIFQHRQIKPCFFFIFRGRFCKNHPFLSMFLLTQNRSFGRLLYSFCLFMSLYAISAFLSASCPHPCLAVALFSASLSKPSTGCFLHAFASDAAKLLETNTNLA